MSIKSEIQQLHASLPDNMTLVAVSKLHPASCVEEAYEAGQRIFGESRPQELVAKHDSLPKDIVWHMIGHLQTNKVKYIAPFVAMIHSVDSDNLLSVINRQAAANSRTIDVLLEVHLAVEATKSGFSEDELRTLLDTDLQNRYPNVRIRGLMTVASQTDDTKVVSNEFGKLKSLFDEYRSTLGDSFDTLSMGMTSDYKIAIECGSTMVRIGSLIFGARDYSK